MDRKQNKLELELPESLVEIVDEWEITNKSQI
jgi:hypothetical protein